MVTDGCPICEHPQREAIDHDLYAQTDQAVLAVRYRVRKAFLAMHMGHLITSTKGRQGLPAMHACEDLIDDVPQVTQNPLSQFKHAWQLAKDDDRMRATMVSWLNEQLQSDDMGLP